MNHELSSADQRRSHLKSNLEHPTSSIKVVNQEMGGVNVVIPTHNGIGRDETIQVTLRSLGEQTIRQETPVRVVIGDNGISETQREVIYQVAETHQLPIEIIDARPQTKDQKNAAYGRNQAIRAITSRAEQDASYRGNFVLVDDDAAMLPESIAKASKVLRIKPDAVAVTGSDVPVRSLDHATYEDQINRHSYINGRVTPRQLPHLLNGRGVDMAAIVAFSGQVSTKTNGLLLDYGAVHDMTRKGGDLFIRWPNGSFEDMALGVCLNKYGRVYQVPEAIVLDQMRETTESLFKQKSGWGRDHVHSFNDFVKTGYYEPGLITVLEPQGNRWIEWVIENTDHTGVLINPEQIHSSGTYLRTLAEATHFDSYNQEYSTEKIRSGVDKMLGILDEVEKEKDRASFRIRTDLPSPTEPDRTLPRWSKESVAFQLAGNIMGTEDINLEADPSQLPQTFFYGVRQSGKWDDSK